MPGPSDADGSVVDRLAVVEQALVGHPTFGDSGYIHDQMAKAFGRRLEQIAERVPAGRRLLESLERANPDWRSSALP